MTSPVDDKAPQAPLLTVLSGKPTDQQVAALTVLFSAMASAAAAAESSTQPERNRWGNVADRLAQPIIYNPTAFHNVSFY